jgi:cell division protein ZapA
VKQIEVLILGQSYMLACPEEDEPTLREAVTMVDAEMRTIRDAGKVKARDRMAVLAALNMAFNLVKNPTPATPGGPSGAFAPAPDLADSLSPAQIKMLIARIDRALVAEESQLL